MTLCFKVCIRYCSANPVKYLLRFCHLDSPDINMPPMESTMNEDVNALTWIGAMFACMLGGALCFIGASSHTWLLVPAIIFTVVAVISPVMYIMHWVGKKKKLKCVPCCRYLLCLKPEQRDAVKYYKAHTSDPSRNAEEGTDPSTKPEDGVETVEKQERVAVELEEKPAPDSKV